MPEPKQPVEPPPTRTVDEVRRDEKTVNREERVKLNRDRDTREQKPTAPVKKSKK